MKGTFKDITGVHFGLLVVLRQAAPQGRKTMWDVRCSCGAEKQVRGDGLIGGRVKSCGCAREQFRRAKLEKRYSLVNQRFGKLMVLWRAERGVRKSRSMMWECKCDCGKLTTVSATALRSGATKSCGCLLNDLWLPQGQAARNALLQHYQRTAKKRGFEWHLTELQFDQLVAGNCFYCGTVPKQVFRVKNCNGDFVYNGIDRRDNDLGYTWDNSVTCCFVCNSMKRTMTATAFIEHLRKVLTHWDNKKLMRATA